MLTVQWWMGLIGGLITTAGMVAVIWAWLRVQFGKTTIELLKEENSAWEANATRLRADITEREAQLTAAKTEVASARAENNMLWERMTQEKNIAALMEMLSKHHERSEATWAKVLTEIQAVRRMEEQERQEQPRPNPRGRSAPTER